MKAFLSDNEFINWQHPAVLAKAKQLADGCVDEFTIAKACFEFVRDEIKHSVDYQLNPVTSSASDVLEHKTGYCYAKSHLLAALLRANGIPAGLCYQRLTLDNEQPPFCLHGLNAVYLPEIGWYRVDARGNKDGVNAQFTPPQEQLAFSLIHPNEKNFETVYAEPVAEIIAVLTQYTDWKDVLENLPDSEKLADDFA